VLIRRRIPHLLETCGNKRALDALCLGLSDPDFDVRFQSARAGVRLIARNPGLRLEQQFVYSVVHRELEVLSQEWEHQGRRRAEDPGESVLLERSDYPRVSRSAEHVFTVLSLSLDPDLMGAALRGVHSPDANLQGTALEYLEASLPEAVRRALWPRIAPTAGPARPTRAARELADELLHSSATIKIDRGRLKGV
jgi:hypothetical protein